MNDRWDAADRGDPEEGRSRREGPTGVPRPESGTGVH